MGGFSVEIHEEPMKVTVTFNGWDEDGHELAKNVVSCFMEDLAEAFAARGGGSFQSEISDPDQFLQIITGEKK